MEKAPVSVVIPARNAAAFIGEALQSVFEQTCRPEEIIVIDDGSTDDTCAQVSRFPGVLCVSQPALGLPHALNHGLRLATKPYFAFIDADDLWPPTKTEIQLGALSSDADLDFVFGLVIQFSGRPMPDVLLSGHAAPGRMMASLTIKRDSFGRVGPFATERNVGSSLEWWARAKEIDLRGKLVPEVALLRRIHENNLGRTAQDPMRDYLGILHSVVNRRRQKR
jgi:glycosyltransferase involved in cell wall biosynthesis